MKRCPYCSDEIQNDSIKCKHCKEFVFEMKEPLDLAVDHQQFFDR